jgi:rod shape-determining protein MreC
MAWPPRQSWTSFSRRERNRALFSAIGSALALFAGLVLLLMSRADPAQGRGLRAAALDGVAPVWAWTKVPIEWAQGIADDVAAYFAAVDRVRELEARMERLKRLREERDALRRENAQLKAMLRVVEPAGRWSRTVAIAGASSGSYVRSAVVAGGRAEGLRVGQPVRIDTGLVGRVVETGQHAARVLLLTDMSSLVPVRVVRTGKPAIVAGVNEALLEVRYVAPTDGPLKVGDRLVTSGDGGVFPPDVPVAVVTGFKGELPVARPVARMQGLGYVTVEAPWLPPLPPPADPAAAVAAK